MTRSKQAGANGDLGLQQGVDTRYRVCFDDAACLDTPVKVAAKSTGTTRWASHHASRCKVIPIRNFGAQMQVGMGEIVHRDIVTAINAVPYSERESFDLSELAQAIYEKHAHRSPEETMTRAKLLLKDRCGGHVKVEDVAGCELRCV